MSYLKTYHFNDHYPFIIVNIKVMLDGLKLMMVLQNIFNFYFEIVLMKFLRGLGGGGRRGGITQYFNTVASLRLKTILAILFHPIHNLEITFLLPLVKASESVTGKQVSYAFPLTYYFIWFISDREQENIYSYYYLNQEIH